MADEEASDNRTEDPTPRRREQAREEGKVAKSPEFAAAVMLLAGTFFLANFGGRAIGRYVLELFAVAPNWLLVEQPSVVGVTELVKMVAFRTAVALAPLGFGLSVVAVAVGLLQTRGIASWKPLEPDFSRIDPMKGFARIFGTEAAVNLVKSALKLAILGVVTYGVLKRAWPQFTALGDASPSDIVSVLHSSTIKMSMTVALAFLAIGGFDYGIQFFRIEKSLKMSRQEIVQEHREQEGDPQIKARIRQIARQRARQRMLTQVQQADVVITNPTHIAIALRYDAAQGGAPVVVAMGERKLAERIKRIAKAAGVPMVENKPLARALLATCKVGAPIPPALYVAIAEILAYVYRLRQRLPAALAERRAK